MCVCKKNELKKITEKHNLLIKKYLTLYPGDNNPSAYRGETPLHTPTGNAPSSESDIDLSSPATALVLSQEEDCLFKEAAVHYLLHRPKRRHFHESYNFNMKCPTPGCNSLGWSKNTLIFILDLKLLDWIRFFFSLSSASFNTRPLHRKTQETFLSLCWWVQGAHNTPTVEFRLKFLDFIFIIQISGFILESGLLRFLAL